MSFNFGSATNGFIAGFNASMTEKLIVDFARDWSKCPVVGLADVIPVDLPAGYFAKIDPIAQAQLIDSPNAYLWPDNTPMPVQEDNRRRHDFIEWNAKRYVYGTWVGDLEKQFTAWDIEAQVVNDLGNQAMLNRAKIFYTTASTTSTYTNAGGTGVNHTATATSLGGGTWGGGTLTDRRIQKTLAAVVQAIEKATVNGVLPMDDLWLVVSPTVADVMARSQEIQDGYNRQESFGDYLTFDLYKNQLQRYGLPPKLYGINLLVDPWIEKTAKIGASDNRDFVAGTNVAYVITKPGGIKSASGGRAFGSAAFFALKNEEMRTEVIDWPIDRRKLVRTTDYIDFKWISSESSYLITSVVS